MTERTIGKIRLLQNPGPQKMPDPAGNPSGTKRRSFTALAAALVMALSACATAGQGPVSPDRENGGAEQADTSYAIGLWIGMSLRDGGMLYDFNYSELLNGIRDIVENRETRISIEDAVTMMRTANAEIQERTARENLRAGEEFLAQNILRSEVSVTGSGLQYEVLRQGNGAKPGMFDTVMIHYELSLVDGSVIGSTFADESPVPVPVGEVIPGLTEGLQLMSAGSIWKFYMPPALGYGENGGGGIPPNTTLIFKVELLSIQQGPARR